MNALAKHSLRAAAENVVGAALRAREALDWLREANTAESLPEGFLDIREDLKSVEGTLGRLTGELQRSMDRMSASDGRAVAR